MFEKKILCNEELYNIYLKYKSYVVYVSNKHVIFWFPLIENIFFHLNFKKLSLKKQNLNFLISVRFKKKNIIL